MTKAGSNLPQFPINISEHQRWACRVCQCRPLGLQKMYGVRVDQFLFSPLSGPLAGSTLAVDIDHVFPYFIGLKIQQVIDESRVR
jgi:hypothetical protein